MAPELSAWTVSDPAAWDAFVTSAPYRSFPQLWAWGELRTAFGWHPLRLAVGEDGGPPLAGAQLLLRRVPLVGWRLAYVPRGPLGELDRRDVRHALWSAMRRLASRQRIATVKVDPEATPDSPFGAALLAAPWRPAPFVQPPRTRLVDLSLDEEALLAGLAGKHRQYVHKAERAGVRVEWIDGDADAAIAARALADFHAIYQATALRAGFVAREAWYYQRVWELFAPHGHVHIGFAVLDDVRVATLFHFTCGDRAVEVYGGMTDAGAESRANYLLKWEAIRHFRVAGCTVYDLWGLATGGIAKFKAGFGGSERVYVGARDLPLRPAPDAALRVLLPAYGLAQRTRLRLSGRHLSGTDDQA